MSEFKDKLISLRRSMGLSQEDFAPYIGVKRQYVSLLETGAKQPGETLAILVDRMIENRRVFGADVPKEAKEEPAESVAAAAMREQRLRDDLTTYAAKIPKFPRMQDAGSTLAATETGRQFEFVERNGTPMERALLRRVVGTFYQWAKERMDDEVSK